MNVSGSKWNKLVGMEQECVTIGDLWAVIVLNGITSLFMF